MQCTNCGHERPRSGNCPHCNAPMTGAGSGDGSYSSLRGWKDQPPGGPGNSLPPRGRPSRPNWDADQRPPPDQGPTSRTPSRPRPSGAAGGPPDPAAPRRGGDPNQSAPRRGGDPNQSAPRRGDPGQSYPRRGDPGGSYLRREDFQDIPDDRALMMSQQPGGLMAPPDEAAFPALPSEEDERALGIRRPAFIPATEERTGKRPTRWRIISGVASIMLLCVGLCGVSSFLLKQNVLPGVLRIAGLQTPAAVSTPIATLDPAYLKGTPLVTPVSTTSTPITSVVTALTINGGATGNQIIPQNVAAVFPINVAVNVVLQISQQAKVGDVVSVQWYLNNENITADMIKSYGNCCSRKVDSANGMTMLFSITSPSPGQGYAEVFYNSTLAYKVWFAIIVPANTPTPVPTKAPAAPTPTPGK